MLHALAQLDPATHEAAERIATHAGLAPGTVAALVTVAVALYHAFVRLGWPLARRVLGLAKVARSAVDAAVGEKLDALHVAITTEAQTRAQAFREDAAAREAAILARLDKLLAALNALRVAVRNEPGASAAVRDTLVSGLGSLTTRLGELEEEMATTMRALREEIQEARARDREAMSSVAASLARTTTVLDRIAADVSAERDERLLERRLQERLREERGARREP